MVGTGQNLTFNPRTMSGCFIHLYRVNPENNHTLEFVHKTPVTPPSGPHSPLRIWG